ncbi:Aminoglycoside phosphotransferase domain-containing protein OS=Streptomyces violarus OX=67380 GN=FHS41_001651 PE=4 SV=1 [Streptomyces violarus]
MVCGTLAAARRDAIDPADAAYLRERRDGFAAEAAALDANLLLGPIHGDALPRMCTSGRTGRCWSTWRTVSADLREHDLVVMALSHDRYGLPDEAYESFTETYGWDVRRGRGAVCLLSVGTM